ncbi:unnamed protein product [Hermetia illucens]|uniref:CUB domain-containing protein n=1 Tax=Hermetia illucens TaxID=343691 RepID=A0A7R8UQP7_HERIL|nr:unnamed protein product [Hermetia illucens]
MMLSFSSFFQEVMCVDQIHIFPHLQESVLQDPVEPEETICFENTKKFVSVDVSSSFLYPMQLPLTESSNMTPNNIESSAVDVNLNFKPLTRSQFRINHRPAIFTSGRVLGMRLIYKSYRKDEEAFKIVGRFQFIDRVLFKNDGNLMATTYCDYQFLPHPINYDGAEQKSDVDVWRYFYSPRYPAKYPNHIKCSYKFVGRPSIPLKFILNEYAETQC